MPSHYSLYEIAASYISKQFSQFTILHVQRVNNNSKPGTLTKVWLWVLLRVNLLIEYIWGRWYKYPLEEASFFVFCTGKAWYNCSHFSMNCNLKSPESIPCGPILLTYVLCRLLSLVQRSPMVLGCFVEMVVQRPAPNRHLPLVRLFGYSD